MVWRRRVRGLFAAVVLAATWAAAGATGAFAHAELIGTDPPDGAVLTHPPTRIELRFSEAVDLDRSAIDIVDASGAAVPVTGVTWVDDGHARIAITMPDSARDAIRVAWRTVSGADLHVTSGSLVFGVGPVGGVAPRTEEPTRVDQVVASAVASVGFCGSLGSIVVWLGLLPGRRSPALPGRETAELVARLRRRLLAVGAGSAVLVMVADLGGLVASAWPELLDGIRPDQVVTSGVAIRAAAAAALACAAAILLLHRRQRASEPQADPTAIALLAIVGGLAWLRASAGHAAAAEPVTLYALAAAAVHALAAGIWVGGLTIIAFAVAPALRRGAVGAELAVWLLRGFAPFAALSVCALLISGLAMAGRVVFSIDALLFSDYGHALAAKVALGVAVALIGLSNHVRLRPALAGRLRRAIPGSSSGDSVAQGGIGGRMPVRASLTIEAVGALGVLALAAVLSATPPAVGAAWRPATAAASTTRVAPVDDLLVTFTIRPNRPGPNFVSVAVHDTRRPAPAPIGTVEARLVPSGDPSSGRIPLFDGPLGPIGEGRFEGVVTLPSRLAGLEATVDVNRPGMPVAEVATGWLIPATSSIPDRPVVVSADPLAPTLDAIVLLLLALSGGATALLVVARRAARTGSGLADAVLAVDPATRPATRRP